VYYPLYDSDKIWYPRQVTLLRLPVISRLLYFLTKGAKLAPGVGIEPTIAESKSVVLPLHYPGIKTVCYIVGFVSLLAHNLTTPWQLCCRTARYHLRLRGVRNNKIKQDVFLRVELKVQCINLLLTSLNLAKWQLNLAILKLLMCHTHLLYLYAYFHLAEDIVNCLGDVNHRLLMLLYDLHRILQEHFCIFS